MEYHLQSHRPACNLNKNYHFNCAVVPHVSSPNAGVLGTNSTLIPAVQSSVGNLLAVNGGPRMTHSCGESPHPALQQWQCS